MNAARQLNQGGFGSQPRLVSAKVLRETATAGIQRANSTITAAQAGTQTAAGAVAVTRDIERLTMTAPFGGLLETDTAALGSLLRPGSPCATIVQVDPVKLVGFVPELHVDRITIGALARAHHASGATVQGNVRFVSREADNTIRTFRVEVTVPHPI